MKKRMAALVLGAALAASAFAPAAQAEEDAAAQVIAERKAEAEESGEYQKVVFAFYNWVGRQSGTDRIQEAMNEILRDKLGLEVELLVMDAASYEQNVRLMLASGEQIDLWNSCPLGYTSVVNDGYCMDLEENDLIQTYGAGILETLSEDYVQACRINGVLYGLPQLRDMAMAAGTYCIGKEYLDAIGYNYTSMYTEKSSEVIYTDYETLDSIFAQLKEAFPDKYVFAVGDNLINQGTIVDPVGGDYFGALLDPVNSLEVENLFTSDLFLEKCQMMYDWNQKGYISKDALTTDTALSAQVKAGTHMAMMAQGKPGYQTQISGECGREMILFQTEPDIMKSSSVTGILWNMDQGSEDTVAAMQLLNELYTNPELSNLIMWGQEGTDYVYTEDGHITFPEGVTAENAEWYHTMNWLLPNQYIANIWEGNELTLWDDTEAFNENSEKSKALGFSFDNSAYASELTALTNVYDEYAKQLLYGFVEPEAGIAEMEAKLEAAGLEEYIAAKQEALNEWAEANGIE